MIFSPIFKLFLLGSPRIERGGQLLHLPRRKALGLLAYLAFTKREAGRETLATLLWPNHDDSHARGNLRRMLSETRKILGQDLLPVRDEWVGPLDRSRIWTDIEEFQHLTAQIRLSKRRGIRKYLHRDGHRGRNPGKENRDNAEVDRAVFEAGQEVRISAQLIEAASDRHVWAESYRGSFANFLELQERIARSVVSHVIDELTAGEEKTEFPQIDPEARLTPFFL